MDITINANYTDEEVREAVELANGVERLAAYNAATGKAVKKFASKSAGIRQTTKALLAFRDRLAAEEAQDAELERVYGRTTCPHCGEHLSNGVLTPGDEGAGLPASERLTTKFECMACGHGWGGPAVAPVDERRSAGVAASWQDAEVREKRRQRNAVEVDGVRYRSVRAAYVALGLPLKEHIVFRIQLKELGEADNYGRHWKIVPADSQTSTVERRVATGGGRQRVATTPGDRRRRLRRAEDRLRSEDGHRRG